MAVLSTSEAIAGRFSSYIGELRDVFRLYGIPFGSASDLGSAAERVGLPGALAEDVSSILRSVILREGGSLPHTELFEILLVAVAGTEFDPGMEQSAPGFRELLSFVGSVGRRPWNVPPGEGLVAREPAAADPASVVVSGDGNEESEEQVAAAAGSAMPSEVVEEPVEQEVVAVPHSVVAAALAALPPPTVRVNGHAAPQASTAWSDEYEGRADAERALDAERDEDEAFEPSVPVLPSPPAWSSGPLWFGAGFAVALIFALTVWTRWLYASHSVWVEGASRPAVVAASASPARPPAGVPLAAPLRPVAQIRRSHAATSSGEDRVSSQISSAVPRAVRERREVRVHAPAPVVRVAEPAVSAAPRSEAAGPAAPAEKAAPEQTAYMPPPPQPWGRTPPTMRSSDESSPYLRVSPGVMASHLLLSPDPGYPTLAKLTHIQGEVTLEAVISSDGEVIATHVLSGHRLLRRAAVSAVKRRRYRPYMVDGRPVDVSTTVTVNFNDVD